jgi:hypothetical protein
MKEYKLFGVMNNHQTHIRKDSKCDNRDPGSNSKGLGNFGNTRSESFELMKEYKLSKVMNNMKMQSHQQSKAESPTRRSKSKDECRRGNTKGKLFQLMKEGTDAEGKTLATRSQELD